MKKSIVGYIAVLMLFALMTVQASAQCSNVVSTFPYQEGFEATNGGWTTGSGTWQWGTPSKQVIANAGGGNKCWAAGGLNRGQLYNASEDSWLQSPCFDFTNLHNPYITFKLIWEIEWKWDAVTLEYTTDGGATWNALGTNNDGANCLNANWYNSTSSKNGWSGNVQPSGTSGSYTCEGGNGSGTWLTAKHVMPMLAGKQQVMFRFHFSGSPICREYYEGFGVDDIVIKETPVAGVDFDYTCSANNMANFINASGGCPTGYLWNFGDVASGVNNVSTDENPVHVFSSPGTYNVSLTAYYSSGPPLSYSKSITIINVSPTIISGIPCNGQATGALKVTVTPNNVYSYSWNTTPVQTSATINNLAAGNYTVTVSTANVCTTSQTIALTQPNVLIAAPLITDAKCAKASGAIDANVTGGTAPYHYQWSNGTGNAIASGLLPGTYSLNVTDNNGCTTNANNLLVKNTDNNIAVFLGNDTAICPGDKLLLDAGIFATYLWQDNSSTQTFDVVKTGKYSVAVTDADGCTASDEINVTVDCSDVYFPTAFTPNGDGNNDTFGPIGNVAAVKHYTFRIYNRFGQLVFESNDPYKKWSGRLQGIQQTATFVWMANYTINGKIPYSKKGTVTIIR